MIAFLKKTELFSKVADHLLPDIASCFQKVAFSPGTVIFHEGDPGDALYLVREGLVRVERECIPVAIRRSGDCVGEMALLDQSPRSSTLVAQTAVRLLRLSAEDFSRIVGSNPEVNQGIYRVLNTKLRENLPRGSGTYNEVTRPITKTPGPSKLLLPGDLSGVLFANRYQMDLLLGSGGMAYVYRADDQLLGVPVAVKILHRISEERMLGRLKQEVVLARKVIHPNVCRIFDFGTSNGLHFVSMELIEGRTLSDWIEESGKLKIHEVLPIFLQVLQALQEVHKRGIIHRDIKPQNIMTDSQGRAVIMDFGVALSKEASARFTLDGQFVGTLHYMAPEQFGTDPFDHRTDLYAMGVVLFESLTGQRPFEADSTAGLMSAHLHSPPPPPRIHPELDRIILKALEKSPENRYQSADEMLRDLQPLRS